MLIPAEHTLQILTLLKNIKIKFTFPNLDSALLIKQILGNPSLLNCSKISSICLHKYLHLVHCFGVMPILNVSHQNSGLAVVQNDVRTM